MCPVTTPVALNALLRPETSPRIQRRLLDAVRDHLHWNPDSVELADLLRLADAVRDDDDFLLGLIERFFYLAPKKFDRATLEHFAHRFGHSPRFKYFAHVAGLDIPAAFPMRAAAKVLLDPAFPLLVVVNSLFGQGDEIVRTVPFLQALLDANPTASITVLSRRRYLFDHPRIEQRSLMNGSEVHRTLQEDYDGVAHFHEPRWAHFNRRPKLIAAVNQTIERLDPPFVLCGDHGDHCFAYPRVRLDAKEWAHERGLHESSAGNIYEPCQRLLIELGLPLRLGEQQSRMDSVLVGTASVDAAHLWNDLSTGRDNGRPVALVNPFGGAAAKKGYLAQHFPRLTAELAGLIEEGYDILLIPNGARWGRRSHAEVVRAQLPPDLQERIAIGPDPAERLPWKRLSLSERPDLNYADRIMRLYKYCFACADLIVTVEGWGSHLAYNLGRPFRLVLMEQSAAYQWHPYARGSGQQLVTCMSPLARWKPSPEEVGREAPGPG